MIAWEVFDEIYKTDLRYVTNCWTLCGDAHCCSFARYKLRFRLLSKTKFQQLPLLPSEYEYLASKDWLTQFGSFEHTISEFVLEQGRLRIEHIVSRRPTCACDQERRPTVCRLYPLLPVYDISGVLTATDRMSIYDDLETIEGMAQACELKAVPFAELQKLFKIANAIGRWPLALFYLTAYRIAKQHVRTRLAADRGNWNGDIFTLFEEQCLSGKLIDREALTSELNALATCFRRHYGSDFCLE